MSRHWSRLAGFSLAVWGSALSAVQADSDARVLDEHSVVALVSKQNPALKAALLDLESARLGVVAFDSQYTPVVQLDGSVSQLASPTLFRTLGVSVNQQRRADVGAELRKHLLWGTDITLRLAGNWLKTEFQFPTIGTASSGGVVTPGITGQTGIALLGSSGPGYGALAKLTLKQPLLRGRGRDVAEADLNASRAERSASGFTRDRVASEQLRDALTAYWELWYASSTLDIQRRARVVAAKQRDDAQARVDSGGLAPVEVLTFETQVASRDEDVASAEAELKRAELELNRLLGALGDSSALRVADEAPPAMLISPKELLEERALAQSAELRERAAAVELSRVRARTAAEPQRQRLDLDAYVQSQGLVNQDGPGVAMRQLETVSAFLGLTYEAPINNRQQRAVAARARVDVEAAEQALLVARQRILTDVGKGIERGTASERKVELARQTTAIAEKQLVAEQARFATGAATSLQVLEAEDRLRSARLRVARAQADLVQAAIALEDLTGQLIARFGH